MSEPIELIVIRNIVEKFIPFRKWVHVDKNHEPATELLLYDDIVNGMKILDYVLINALDEESKLIPIMVLYSKECMQFSSANFRKDIQIMLSTKKTIRELIIVGPSPFFDKNNLANVINEFRNNGIKIYTYGMENFAIPLLEHEGTAEYEVISDPEKVLETLDLIVNIPPAITAKDAINVWLGAKPGDLIKVLKASHTSGFMIEYFLVRP